MGNSMASVDRDRFSYGAYRELLRLLAQEGYAFRGFDNWHDAGKVVIMRHDVDYSLDRVLPIARIEAEFGVSGTYFFLLRGDFYNAFSRKGRHVLSQLHDMGHAVGLHFDETLYAQDEDFVACILKEASLLGEAANVRVKSVSMHRPSKKALEQDWHIPGMENAYSKTYFEGFKYLSDSRMHWREDAVRAIRSGCHDRLQILTHPFWYRERPLDLPQMLEEFIGHAEAERVMDMNDNFDRLDDEIGTFKIHAARIAAAQDEAFGTERLVLRPLRMADADDMFEYASDAEVCRFLSWGPYECREQAAAWIDTRLARVNPTDVLLGVEERASGKLIGVVRAYNVDSPENSAEISYILNPAFQGKGYMTEAAQRVIELLFDGLGVSCVYAYCVEDNNASSRLMERIGMHRDGSFSQMTEIKGRELKSVRYVIDKE